MPSTNRVLANGSDVSRLAGTLVRLQVVLNDTDHANPAPNKIVASRHITTSPPSWLATEAADTEQGTTLGRLPTGPWVGRGVSFSSKTLPTAAPEGSAIIGFPVRCSPGGKIHALPESGHVAHGRKSPLVHGEKPLTTNRASGAGWMVRRVTRSSVYGELPGCREIFNADRYI